MLYSGSQIDSIMSTRSINENEASRRLKSEFLIQFDGVTSNPDDLVIVIGMIPANLVFIKPNLHSVCISVYQLAYILFFLALIIYLGVMF